MLNLIIMYRIISKMSRLVYGNFRVPNLRIYDIISAMSKLYVLIKELIINV